MEPKQHRFNVNSKLVCIIFHPLSTNPKTWPARLEDTGFVTTIMSGEVLS